MLEWRNAFSLLVRPRCLATNWPTGSDDRPVRLSDGNNRGSVQTKDWSKSAGEGPRLWTISTELLVEAGVDNCTRADRR
jgi:hypothetical protein